MIWQPIDWSRRDLAIRDLISIWLYLLLHVSKFNDSITDWKPRLSSFNRLSNHQNWTHVAKVVAKSNHDAKSIDLVEMLRMVVKSPILDPCRLNLGKFAFCMENYDFLMYFQPAKLHINENQNWFLLIFELFKSEKNEKIILSDLGRK